MSRNDSRKYPLYLPHIKPTRRGKFPTPLGGLGLSLVYAFYNNEAKRFDLQWENWFKYPKPMRDQLHIVIVDDGAEVPIVNFVRGARRKILSELNIEFYRIKQDLRWNTPGALNLGVLQAPTDWVLTLDSDCIIEYDHMKLLLDTLSPDNRSVFFFERTKRIYKDKIVYRRYHPCAMLMHKQTFKDIGGFDEDFTGERSGGYAVWDRDFECRVPKFNAYRSVIMNVDITEYMPDVTGGSIQTNMEAAYDKFETNRILMRDKHLGRKPFNRNLLNFEWVKETP